MGAFEAPSRMLSSAGEHRPYKAGVAGSKPAASTIFYGLCGNDGDIVWVNSEVAKRG